MHCPACRSETPDEAKFCSECGAPLAARCAGCGGELPAAAKFCPECGAPTAREATREPRDYTPKHLAEKILTQKAALEGERKRVTVLFADVRGSMDLQERIDPEEWHEVMDHFFGILSESVHRFEGSVNQYTGDGIMALFGAPIAHEDHAQRACFAALQMRDALLEYARDLKREKGLQFSTRIGINSGEVVVGKIGDDLRMDYTAQGHTVGLAARMEELASPDTIYVSQAAADLCTGYFDLEDLGAFNVKGASEPVGVHQLRGVGKLRTRFDVSRARGLSRFVGRDDEMQILERAVEQAREGHGQVVGVVAHAGVGKSRLCFEFLEKCRARGMLVTQGNAVPHGKSLPLLPVMEAFRAYYGIGEEDDPRTVREKIAGRVLLLDESFREVLPLVFDFFGAPDPDRPPPRLDPDARRRQLVGVLRRVVQKDEWDQPVVTLLEDLHWFDGGSEAFLREWVDALAGARNVLILNFRPEYRADWMQSSHYRQIPLQPLGAEAIRELLGDLLGADRSVAGLADAIHERTRGNPFFTEEVVRALIEDGHLEGTRGAYRLTTPISGLQVPDSVHGVLAARIDRLAEREKQVLQTAAVIGKTFEEQTLEAVASLGPRDLADALAALKSGEFVYEESLYPVVEYAFRHPLTQEVALHSQLGDRRRRLHAAVAGVLQELKADHLDEQSALIAHHWEQADEPLQAARWATRAARVSSFRSPREAVRLRRKVIELTRPLRDSAEATRLRMDACREVLASGAWRIGMEREEVEAIFEEGRRLGAESGDRNYLLAIETAHLPVLGVVHGDVKAYAEAALACIGLAEETGDLDLLAVATVGAAYSHFLLGRLPETLEYSRRLVAMGEHDPDVGVETVGFGARDFGTVNTASIEGLCGDLEGASRKLEAAVRALREAGKVEVLGWALNSLVELRTRFGGELGESASLARESLGASERLGSWFSVVHSLVAMATVQLFREEWDGAVDSLERALAITRDERTGREQVPLILAWLAEARLGRGEAARARELAEEALARARETGCVSGEIHAILALSRVQVASGAPSDEVLALLDRAASLVAAGRMRVHAPGIAELRARFAGLRGDDVEREARLREALALYAEMGASGHRRRLEAELAGTPAPDSSQ